MFDNIINHPGHAVVGAVIGQLLLPVPILGAAVGAIIGGHVGKREEEHDIHMEIVRGHIEAEENKK